MVKWPKLVATKFNNKLLCWTENIYYFSKYKEIIFLGLHVSMAVLAWQDCT
jgi:hypothetical protein